MERKALKITLLTHTSLRKYFPKQCDYYYSFNFLKNYNYLLCGYVLGDMHAISCM